MSFESSGETVFEGEQKIFERSGKKQYNLENSIPVEVDWNEFVVEGKKDTPCEKAVIFLPGWAMGVQSAAIRELCETYAREMDGSTFAVQTRSEVTDDREAGKDVDFLYEEAKAVAEFVRENGMKEIVVVGHSQGGDKGINVVTLLQNNTSVKITGLVLLASVGLYEQNPSSLTANFITDAVWEVPGSVIAHEGGTKMSIVKTEMRTSIDVVKNIFRELFRSRSRYKRRLDREVEEMSQVNHRAKEVSAPIVLISGDNDRVSNPDEIVEDRLHEREAQLKESIFHSSPWVRMFIPGRLAHHKVLFSRPETVARSTVYLLRRSGRDKKDENTA